MENLPHGFRSDFADCGEVRLHFVTNAAPDQSPQGQDPRTPIVFLHGFPEFWRAWEPVFRPLASDYQIIALDQRGFNLSDAPADVSNYTTRKLVGDLVALTSQLLGKRAFVLAGHDWGASVAYAAAIGFPQMVRALVIANGVHPVLFQKALIDDAGQRKASQYIHVLKDAQAAARMSENSYARTLSMLEKFSAAPWLDAGLRQAYIDAFSKEGRLDAMLNWYRASPIVVPKPDEDVPLPALYHGTPDQFAVTMPHLLIWGLKDTALLPVSRKGIETFASKVELVEFETGDHWLLHTHGPQIAAEIDQFVKRNAINHS
ncbi:MAG: alpha/beta hydrolase [Rhizobiaceae bacterium]